MKISVSSYSFNQLLKEKKITQLDTVRLAAEMGFDGIEFTDLRPNDTPTLSEQLAYAEQIKKEAEKYGISIVSYTIGANLYQLTPEANDKEVERLKGQVDVAVALGAPSMRHDVCYSEKYDGKIVSFDRMLPVIAENARRVSEYAQSKGIRTCTENHGYIAQDSDRVEKLYNTVGHENYGLLIDMGNFACADEDSIRAVSRLAPYAIHAHAKDFVIYPFGTEPPADAHCFSTRACNKLAGCAIGDGDIPVAQCIAILKRAGYDGFLSIEYEGSEDCLVGIKRGLEYLRSVVE